MLPVIVLIIGTGFNVSFTAVAAQTPHATPTATGSVVQLTTGDIMATARSQPTIPGTPIQHPNRKPDRGSLPQNPDSPDQFATNSSQGLRALLVILYVFIVTLILMGRGIFFNCR